MSYQRIVISEFGGPEKLELVSEASLPVPKSGEIRIRVLATSAAFTDTMIRKGKYPDVKQAPPFSPGYDMVGIVDALGPDTRRFNLGDTVAELTVTGAYSEYLCLPESQLTPVPEGLDPVDAVSLILSYVTAYQMLHRLAHVRQGQSILVHGAGGAVGSAMLQLGQLFGLEMFGTASTSKQALLKELGATPIDYTRENWQNRIRELKPEGVDAVFDAIGGDHFAQSFSVLRKGGVLIGYGFYNAVMGRGGSIVGDFLKLKLWNLLPNGKKTGFYSIAALRKSQPGWFSEDLGALLALLEQDKIKPVVEKCLPLKEARLAHELIESAAIKGKIVLRVAAD